MIRALLLVMLSAQAIPACAPQFGEPIDPGVVQRAAQDWRAHGFAYPEQCGSEVGDARVRLIYVSSADAMLEYCRISASIPAARKAAACTVQVEAGESWNTSIAVRSDLGPQEQSRALEHELRHWLLRCSSGDSDHGHARSDAWYPMRDGRAVLGAGDRAQ